MNLETPLSAVLGTTEEHIQALEGMGLRNVQDLLLYLPRTHEDLSAMETIRSAKAGEKATLRGTVQGLKLVRTHRGKIIVSGLFIDEEGGSADLTWFNQPHILRMLKDGDEVVLSGKITQKGRGYAISNPAFEKEGAKPLLHAGRIVPVYPEHNIINTKWLRGKMVRIKNVIDQVPETLPSDVIEQENLMTRSEMIKGMHFPDHPSDVQKALERLAFEEVFQLQKDGLQQKKEWQSKRSNTIPVPMHVALIRLLFTSLQFTPTDDQRRAIYEILKDMEQDYPMSRLLEGDVGSGKTLVATAVMANVVACGGQCALMVPTEVLASQHAETISKMLMNFWHYLERRNEGEIHIDLPAIEHPPRVVLLTGSIPEREARELRTEIALGHVDIVIGTHALIEDSVVFSALKLVIVDEQHRFGVHQRYKLREKGSPHFLAMTATPIPRTLALTAYGHHDLSVLFSKPRSRKKIQTKIVLPTDRITVERFIDHQIEQGRQAFVICPLIKQSSNDDMQEIRSVEEESKRLQEEFPRRRVAILHGKMLPKEKEETMRRFKEKHFDLLISTSVIEVGIDVPNATIILIEGSERFGLAQLHQFRGRVGRSEEQSYCFLATTEDNQRRSARLKAMEKYDSGFALAEIDLKLRGPGELFGMRQSGLPDVRVSSLMQPELVVRARRAAEQFLGLRSAKEGV